MKNFEKMLLKIRYKTNCDKKNKRGSVLHLLKLKN